MPDDVPNRPTRRRRLTADEPSPPSVSLDVPNMPREDTKSPGIRMKMLRNDPAGGVCTMPTRLEPGATAPLHEHTAIEQTWVPEGRFLDEEGECGPGRFVRRPPGSTHVAWAGPEGATVLGIFLKPNVFADGRKFFSQDRGPAA